MLYPRILPSHPSSLCLAPRSPKKETQGVRASRSGACGRQGLGLESPYKAEQEAV